MEDLSGQVIRGYELREQIGTGGFGAVYRAYQKSVDREVAIKIILPEFANKPEFVQRFEAEARLIARLEHFHIVPLFDYWHEPGGNAYLVMRWLRGGSLRDVVADGPLGFDLILRLLHQLAEALSAAHRAGVVHRDIKPDNILLDEQHNAYLSDFGIAKDMISSVHLTKSGTIGSPGYMSPEQFFGEMTSPQSDIYSLGMTLYECVCGEHAFPDNPMLHFREPVPRPSARRDDVPPALDAVLLRATAKDPEARYATVADFARAFEQALSERVSPPKPVTPADAAGAPPPQEEPAPISRAATLQAGGETIPLESRAPGDPTALLLESEGDVPYRARKLIGRDTLLAEIQALLDQGERVLLQGIGGIGKTSLAAEVIGARLREGKGPALWLRAGDADAAKLMLALARALDPDVVMSSDANPQAIRKLLGAREARLIALDDAWNDEALRYLLDALPPRLPLLVTSRHRMPGGKIIDVGELELATALQLLSYHAGQAFDASDSAAADLCRALGNHPFALEIAGNTLQVDELTPGEFLQRMSGAPHLIRAPGDSGEPGRASVRDLLDASVEALDEETRSVFFAFGALFAPQATPEMIARLMNRTADNELTTLGRRGLAKRTRQPDGEIATFRLHDLAYSFARAGTPVTRAQAVEACRGYTTQYIEDVDRLDAERANILKAAQAAHEAGDTASLLAIMRALTVDGPYLSARGHDALLLEQLDRAVETARSLGSAQAETLHFLLGKRADAYYERNQLAAALADYRESLDLARALDRRDRVVILLCVASKTLAQQGDTAAAEAYLAEAEQIATASGDNLLVSRVLENQGYYYAVTKQDLAAARDIFARQAEIAERLDNPGRLFFALINLGVAETELGKYEAGFAPLQRALQVARDADRQPWQAHALYALATIHHKQDQRDQAQHYLDEALALYRDCGNTAKVEELTGFMTDNQYPIAPSL